MELSPVSSEEDFLNLIDELINDYEHYIEQRGGGGLLFNDNGKEKDEVAAQLLFRGVVEQRCKMNGIVVDREVELGVPTTGVGRAPAALPRKVRLPVQHPSTD